VMRVAMTEDRTTPDRRCESLATRSDAQENPA
jgi:hypothetical protein